MRVWVLALVLLLVACSGDPAPLHRERLYAMGTTVELITHRASGGDPHAAAALLGDTLAELEQRWHPYREGALLAGLNQALATAEGAVTVHPELRPGLTLALGLAAASGDRFDPGLGRAVQLWGFHEGDRAPAPPPSAEALAAVRPTAPAAQRLLMDRGALRAPTGTVLDLGALAKGLAAEEGLQRLRGIGIGAGILNLGGDLVAWGQPGERRWRIAVRHPRADSALVSLELGQQEAVFTSGDYERWFEHEGVRYHHILDPLTAMPARGLTSVTVVHPSPTIADAAATAGFVAGEAGWRSTLAAMGVDQAMVVTEDGRVIATAALAPRLRVESEPPVSLEVVP